MHVGSPASVISTDGAPPPELLAPPERGLRHLDHSAAADAFDGWLVRLASQENRCRRVLGVLCDALRRRSAWERLGFARLSDYAAERLGVSASEMRALAGVARGLDGLPAVAAAFERGEVSWSKVRLLVKVADAKTEARWIAAARELTVRGLRAAIEAEAKCAAEKGDELLRRWLPDMMRELDEQRGRIESEAAVRFRVRCPPAVARLWRRAVELSRAVAGADVPLWKAAESIAAEASSSVDPDAPVEAASEDRVVSDEDDARRPTALRQAFPDLPTIDWSAVAAAVPLDVDGLVDDAPGLDAFELDERLRSVRAAMQKIDWQVGRLLRTLATFRLHRLLGFAAIADYASERLGISPRKARALMAIERRAEIAPELRDAFRGGELSWIRALLVLPVVGERNAGAWIERARGVTVRRLAAEIDWALDAREAARGERGVAPLPDPPPAGMSLTHDPERQTCAPGSTATADVAFTGPASVVGLFRGVVGALAGPGEPLWRGLERVLLHAVAEWESLPRHPDPVFRRDGWRCAVPACSSRSNLHDHHVVFRSRGGTNARDNRTATCAWHHLRGIHAGLVRVSGEAPDGLVWQLGVRRGGPALMVFRGDTYVGGSHDAFPPS